MTENGGAPVASLKPGTGADYLRFLDWAEKKGEVPTPTVQNWRNASTKVLEIEDNWHDLDLINLDLEAHIGRFVVLKRTSYTEGSMNAYKSRTRGGIEAYRKWIANPGSSEWKPKVGGSRPTKNGEAKTPKTGKRSPASSVTNGLQSGGVESVTPSGSVGGLVANRAAIIEYPFPLRPGVRAVLFLPEDLNDREAKRLARFVESLAITEQLAIAGRVENS
jgi:hypothetical protein